MTIVWALAKSGLTATCAEARRLICNCSVRVNNRLVEDIDHVVSGIVKINVGKRDAAIVNISKLSDDDESNTNLYTK